jgi:hypothetical protein
MDEILTAQQKAILLPDEPLAFNTGQAGRIADLLVETPAAQNYCFFPIDGSLITGRGTRLSPVLRELQVVMEGCGGKI